MHQPDARRKLGHANSRRLRKAATWERKHPGPHDPDIFTHDILPGLRFVPLRSMMKATGLSLRTCSRVRQGKTVPHARWWDAFALLASALPIT